MKIAAVVVTHNRLDLLKRCLEAVRCQSRPPDEVFVIDNASTDGTHEWLARCQDLSVIQQANLGSAGGQHRGIKEAMRAGHDFVWCLDDDTLPTPGALEALAKRVAALDGPVGFVCSRVIWRDGTTHAMNAPNFDPAQPDSAQGSMRAVKAATFVSVMFSRQAVRRRGLPIADFHIWLDDTEYTQRVARALPSFYVGESVVEHHTAQNCAADLSLGQGWDSWKARHAVRNLTFLQSLASGAIPGTSRRSFASRFAAFGRITRLAAIHNPPHRLVPLAAHAFYGAFFFRPQVVLGSDFSDSGDFSEP